MGVAATAEIDEVHTMRPPPAASMPGRTARVIMNMERTFTSMSASYSLSVVSRNGLTTMVPAWLNKTVGAPNVALACATAASTWARCETSACTKLAW